MIPWDPEVLSRIRRLALVARHADLAGGVRREARLALVRDHDGNGLVRLEDGGVLDDVADDGAADAGRADDDQRIG